MNHQPRTINVAVNDDDIIPCPCGCQHFTPVHKLALPRGPLVGQPVGLIVMQQWQCIACKEILGPDAKPLRERMENVR